MKTEEIVNRLIKVDGLKDYIDLILEMGVVVNIKSHELLFEYENREQFAYIVLHGGFVLQHMNLVSGDLRTVNFFLQDFQPILVTETYFKGVPSKYQSKAIGNSWVLKIAKGNIEELLQTNINLKEFYINHLIESLLLENELKTHLISSSSEAFLSI